MPRKYLSRSAWRREQRVHLEWLTAECQYRPCTFHDTWMVAMFQGWSLRPCSVALTISCAERFDLTDGWGQRKTVRTARRSSGIVFPGRRQRASPAYTCYLASVMLRSLRVSALRANASMAGSALAAVCIHLRVQWPMGLDRLVRSVDCESRRSGVSAPPTACIVPRGQTSRATPGMTCQPETSLTGLSSWRCLSGERTVWLHSLSVGAC